MDVVVDRPVRTRATSLMPSDFDDIAPCRSVQWGEGGALVVTFAADLTPDQLLAVKVRCISVDPDDESILTAAVQAYRSNQDFLGLATPTAAQSIAQVAALTRQIQGVLRSLARL